MIEFYSQTDFALDHPEEERDWLSRTAQSYEYEIGDLSYIFCNDDQLLELNNKFLGHDTYTDIITFDYNLHRQINGEIYISIDRVRENSDTYKQSFTDELHRVMVHGLLHLCGLKDKSETDRESMTKAENRALERR